MGNSNVGAKGVNKSSKQEREETDIKSHKDIDGFTQWIEEEDARELAIVDVYNKNTGVGETVNGWTIIRVDKDDSNGFFAKLYEKDGHFAYVTAGTEDKIDWEMNYLQQMGKITPQYETSIQYAKELAFNDKYRDNLIFIGHSLGGGEASANSRATGINAITFNSAALSDRYRNGGYPDSKIVAYINEGDILDYANHHLLGGQNVEGIIIKRKVVESNSPSIPVHIIGAMMGISPALGTTAAMYQINRGIDIHSSTNVIK